MNRLERRLGRLTTKVLVFVTNRELRIERDFYEYNLQKLARSPLYAERLAEFREIEIEYETGDQKVAWSKTLELYRLEPALRYEVLYNEAAKTFMANPNGYWTTIDRAKATRRIVAEAKLILEDRKGEKATISPISDDDLAFGSRRS